MVDQNLICQYSGLPSTASYINTLTDKARKVHSKKKVPFDPFESDRIIQMAWEDRTPFEAIELQFGLSEKEVIRFMRSVLVPSSFRRWRKRMESRITKHSNLRTAKFTRFKCTRQKAFGNKIAKR